MTFLDQLRRCWLTAFIGCILSICGSGILFWNEGRAVHIAISLEEAISGAVSISGSLNDIDHMYEGRLVHLVGAITVEEPLTEPDYGIQVQAVKLKRRVQMFQWIEETIEHKFGESVDSITTDERTYYYVMDWRDQLIDTRSFYIRSGHENPKKFPIESRVQVADHVQLGAYELGDEIKARMAYFVDITSDSRPEEADVKLHSGLYYHCNDVWNPEVGDIRIQFSFAAIEGSYFTVTGKLEGGKIVPYYTSQNARILFVSAGEQTLAQSFKNEQHTLKLTTWGFRFFGWILLFLSATCMAPLTRYMFTFNRILINFAPDPVYPVSSNFIISFTSALLIASISWVFNRPWIGFGLLFAALSPYLYCARGIAQYQHVN